MDNPEGRFWRELWLPEYQKICQYAYIHPRVCYIEAGRQWQGYVNRTIADNETGDVKNGCKSHQPQNWDRSLEKVW